MSAYEPCPGSGKPRKKNSGSYRRAGNTAILINGCCSVCGKRCKLTLDDRIVRHKQAPERPEEATE